jgi:hypothetical protein
MGAQRGISAGGECDAFSTGWHNKVLPPEMGAMDSNRSIWELILVSSLKLSLKIPFTKIWGTSKTLHRPGFEKTDPIKSTTSGKVSFKVAMEHVVAGNGINH